MLSHATNNENETAEVAQIAESHLFSASSAFSAVIFRGGNRQGSNRHDEHPLPPIADCGLRIFFIDSLTH